LCLPVPNDAVVSVPLIRREMRTVRLASRILEQLYRHRPVGVVCRATHELDKLARTAGVKDVVAARYQFAFVPFNGCVAASREGRRHAVIPEAPYPLLGRVEGVSAVEHRPDVTCELLRHATALRLRQRVERISHQTSKLDGVVAVLCRNVEQDGQSRAMDKA
jgi:hypothetical protein